MDLLDLSEFQELRNMEGFHAVEGFPRGKIYQNGKKVTKVVTSLKFSQSARSLVELFLHFDNWNQKIKGMKIVQSMEKGVYKAFINFFKTGCFSKERVCEVIISLYKVSDGYFLTIKSEARIPPHIKKEQWLHFKLAVRIKESLDNFSEKKMVVSVEAQEDSKMVMEFVREIRHFQEYLKGKLRLPSKSITVKATLEE